MSRVVVVGAGVGGLSAAARLAALGHDVTVCEQADAVGGKLQRFERDGFRFDVGPSLLTLPAVFRDLFLKTGRPLESVLELVPLDVGVRYRFPDGTVLDLPNTGDSERLRVVLDGALGTGRGAEWLALLDRAAALWDTVRRPFLEQPLHGTSTLARLAMRRPRDVFAVAPWRSLRALGHRQLADPRLRRMLDRYATYSGSDPRRAPSVLAVVPYVEQAFGYWYVRGGLHRLVDAIHDRALERGATVLTGADVVAVSTSGGRVDGVRLRDDSMIAADVVVANADAAHVYRDLLPHPRTLRRLERAETSYSGFMLLLGLRGRSSGAAQHTVLFPNDYDAEFDDLAAGRVVGDPALYVSVPPDLGPPSGEAWFVLVNAPRHGQVDWDAPGVAAAYAQRLLDLLAQRGHDVRDRLEFAEWRTPADLERWSRAPGGAIYGTSANGWRAAFLRPGNRGPVDGLFLVGGSAHPGGGLPLVGLSAAIVADLIGPA